MMALEQKHSTRVRCGQLCQSNKRANKVKGTNIVFHGLRIMSVHSDVTWILSVINKRFILKTTRKPLLEIQRYFRTTTTQENKKFTLQGSKALKRN